MTRPGQPLGKCCSLSVLPPTPPVSRPTALLALCSVLGEHPGAAAPPQLCAWEWASTGVGRQGSSPEWPCSSLRWVALSQPTKSPWEEASGEMRWEILKVCSAMRHPNGKCSCLVSDIQDTVTLSFPSMAVSLIVFPHSPM